MIRFKDKEIEEYFIDPETAVITDKNGAVQETYLHHGRPAFKGMDVHCIQVHTHFGYKHGYDVHHKDENPLNNSLSNLVYLTRSEHTRLHTFNRHWDEDFKEKERVANKKAWSNAELRKKHSSLCKEIQNRPEVKEKQRLSHLGKNKGKHCWHNASGEIKLTKDYPGEGWLPGRK